MGCSPLHPRFIAVAASTFVGCNALIDVNDVYLATEATGASAGAGDAGGFAKACEEVVVEPPLASFGEVRVGRTVGGVTYPMTVRNSGVHTRTFRASTSPPFAIVDASPRGLAPGEARQVGVTFAPSADGLARGELRVELDDGCVHTSDRAWPPLPRTARRIRRRCAA